MDRPDTIEKISLENKVAIVTGAGRGIGRAIARDLARHGAHLVISDIDFEAARSVALEIQAWGCESLAVVWSGKWIPLNSLVHQYDHHSSRQ